MSYEGYEQVLCEHGHLSIVDCYSWSHDEWRCEATVNGKPCGAKCAFINSVDETNGESCGIIEEFEVAQEVATEVCPTCGHAKVVSHTRYKIPTPEQAQKMRKFPEYPEYPEF